MKAADVARSGGVARRSVLVGLCGAGIAVTGYMIWRRIPPNYDGGKLTVAQAYDAAIAGSILLIDIRTPKEWRQTGVGQGAYPIDMRRDDFLQALSEVTEGHKDRAIALICARGVRSARLSRKLSQAGFTSILDVPEGMLGSGAGPGWLAGGLPVNVWNEVSS